MEARPRGARTREPLIGGIVLIVIGTFLLAAQYVPDIGRFIPLAVGLGLLAAFVATRDYGWLVAGSIVTGVGTGILLASTLSGTPAGAAFMFSLGGGFIAIWLVSTLLNMAERHWWPLVPGLVLAGVGSVIVVGGAFRQLLSLWPLVLIIIGLIMLASWFAGTRRPT